MVKKIMFGKFSTPKVFPSINDIAANPNIIFAKKAPNNRILVICQRMNCGEVNL